MLKKRSRPVSSISNQTLMADPFLLHSPTNNNYNKPPASPRFPLSPRVFVGFSPKGFSDHEAASMSPTSILETKPFTGPFFAAEKSPRKPFGESPQEPKARQPIGLGIVDELKRPAMPESRMVLFGSQLKIQIPSSPRVEFGAKNRDAVFSSAAMRCPSPMGAGGLVSGCISASEMEMSEDYTCVIAHGPNPRTIHIFDNCIMESCGGNGFVAVTPRQESSRVSDDFLTCCHTCKKKLGEGKDIFMYRGERAFCSSECRYQEILIDEGMEDSSPTPLHFSNTETTVFYPFR